MNRFRQCLVVEGRNELVFDNWRPGVAKVRQFKSAGRMQLETASH